MLRLLFNQAAISYPTDCRTTAFLCPKPNDYVRPLAICPKVSKITNEQPDSSVHPLRSGIPLNETKSPVKLKTLNVV